MDDCNFIPKIEKRPTDWLPDGENIEGYVKKDKEWPNLEKRLGISRILRHVYLNEVLRWAEERYKSNTDNFSFFEAGCGHGNDLRAIKKKIGEELGEGGTFLGVDMSEAEILHGMEYYEEQDQENPQESQKLFAQGNLRDLKNIAFWNDQEQNFSVPGGIEDGKFSLVYFEAVLHGLGYGEKTHEAKKAAAQEMLNELYRVCKADGKIFGRVNVFRLDTASELQFERMRKANEWRFFPGAKELEGMLTLAGFKNIKTTIAQHDVETEKRKNLVRLSFLASK